MADPATNVSAPARATPMSPSASPEVISTTPSASLIAPACTGTRTALQRQTDVKKLNLALRGDLDWIVMKCLEKDRTRRYDTASGLAADIHRHLANEPVVARPPKRLYRFQKSVRRNKLAFAAGTTLATLENLDLELETAKLTGRHDVTVGIVAKHGLTAAAPHLVKLTAFWCRALLDVPNYIDYMLMWMFGGAEDEYRAVGPNVPGSGLASAR